LRENVEKSLRIDNVSPHQRVCPLDEGITSTSGRTTIIASMKGWISIGVLMMEERLKQSLVVHT